jgi:hypothetical protein
MRNFWKRTNRGLLLGGVLILGTGIYVGMDYYRFNHSKDDMEQTIRSYASNLAKLAITPDSQAVYGYQLTDAEKDTQYSALEQLIRSYWTDTYDNSEDYYIRRSDLLLTMHALVYNDYPSEMAGYITDYTVNISKLKLTKNGPNAALFNMTMDVLVDSYGYTAYPALDGMNFIDSIGSVVSTDSWDDDEDDEASEDDTYYDGALRTTASITYTGELLYEDGAWKISWMNDYGNSFQTESVKGGT